MIKRAMGQQREVFKSKEMKKKGSNKVRLASSYLTAQEIFIATAVFSAVTVGSHDHKVCLI